MQVQPSNSDFSMSWIRPVHEDNESPTSASEAVVSELGHAFAAAVDKTLHACQFDQSRVTEARLDMVSNRLETSEAFEQAAENLLTFGL